MSRYALYFAPKQQSKWWQAGCQWLGRDPTSQRSLEQIRLPNVIPKVLQRLTTDARRYGFHATLKAPFRLAERHGLGELEQSLAAFCRRQKPIEIPSPQVEWIGNFLALRPGDKNSAIHQLAMQCVSHFDYLRAPLRPEELARRQQQQLSARQLRLLQHWGYPYTAEEYRFHMTLTDALNNTDAAEAIERGARQHFDIGEPLIIHSIALFYEAASGDDFQLLRHYAFNAD
ncbi:DUF1045 domain-containing protein [Undibacterium sp. RuRC25W]|uniref:DUF1045 domain-containing protein n=1 Tax=Undibacterium sp. RuRC25W TaxID=3413047 RepID=UPI003BF0DF67